MPLPSSGVISLNDVRIELEKPSSTISLNNTAVRALAGKPTGMIVMPQDLWGKSYKLHLQLKGTIFNFNLVNTIDSIQSGYRGAVALNMDTVVIRGTLGNVAANLYGQFTSNIYFNSNLSTLYHAAILGHGGSGGAGGTAGANNGLSGAVGGTAIKMRVGQNVVIERSSHQLTTKAGDKLDLPDNPNAWISIYGGGGGGGGGGGCEIGAYNNGYYDIGWSGLVSIRVAGGGGGAGYGGQVADAEGMIASGGGAAGSGQTTISNANITFEAPTAGKDASGYYTQPPSHNIMQRNQAISDGGTGGKVTAKKSDGSILTIFGGNGGFGNVYGLGGGAGSNGNLNGVSGSAGTGGAGGSAGESVFQAY